VDPRYFRYSYTRPPHEPDTFSGLLLDSHHETLVFANQLHRSDIAYIDGLPIGGPGDVAVWFLFKGASFDIARVYTSAGEFRGYYVDATEPISWTGSNVSSLAPIVDLFLDLWIWPHGGYSVLDQDELEEAHSKGWISDAQVQLAESTIQQLIEENARGIFPPARVIDFALENDLIEDLLSIDFRP
jgi:predicted RNA-binding protein associated with RNAse of E/G family